MSKRFAFLRAINVGGRTVRMEQLRKIFVDLGFSAVETFIASGNVVFDAGSGTTNDQDDEAAIESGLRKALGYEVVTFVRSDAQLTRIGTHPAFPSEEMVAPGNDVYVTFLKESPAQDSVAGILALRSAVDDLCVDGSELYWLRRRELGDSLIQSPAVERALRMPGTTRNIKTVHRLVAKYAVID